MRHDRSSLERQLLEAMVYSYYPPKNYDGEKPC
jgi:hypothetical protein